MAGVSSGCSGTDVCYGFPEVGHVVGGVQRGVGLRGNEDFAAEAMRCLVNLLRNAATEIEFESCPNAEESEGQNFHPIST